MDSCAYMMCCTLAPWSWSQTFLYVNHSAPTLHKVPVFFFFSSWENFTEFFHIPWGSFEVNKMASEH